LGEVETVLRGLPQVRHAIVDAVPGGDGHRLVAYCTLAEDADEVEVSRACAEVLPPALVPSTVIALDEFPLNTAGKVDIAALRTCILRPAAPDGRAPADPVETAVAATWCRVLDQPAVSADDDFFGSGGHSVAAMRLVAELRS